MSVNLRETEGERGRKGERKRERRKGRMKGRAREGGEKKRKTVGKDEYK